MGVDEMSLEETKTDMQARIGHDDSIVVETAEQLGVDEKKLVRKLDMHLIPFVMLAYLLSFLDR